MFEQHEEDCRCEDCIEERQMDKEFDLYSMFPNAETQEDLEEELDHSLSRMLDR